MINSIKKGSLLINILLGISLFIFSFGQIGRIGPFEMPIYGNVYEGFLFLATFFLIVKLRILKNFWEDPLIKSVILFFSWLILSFLISSFSYKQDQNIIGVLYLIRLAAYFIFFLYFSAYIKKYSLVVPYFKMLITGSTILVIIFSLVQYFLYPNIGNLAYLGWDPHLYRLVGLFFDPPITASVFGLLILFFIFNRSKISFKIFFVVTLSILFILTYSRGGFLSVLVTLILYSLRKMKFKYLVGFIAVLAILFFIIPKNLSEGLNLTRTASIETRFIDYDKAIKIWEKQPIIGIGYNHIRFEKDSFEEKPLLEKYNPSHASSSFHSSFLIILVTGGVIGLAIYLLVLGRTAMINEFAFYSIIFLSVYSLTDNVLLHPFILFLLFLLIPIRPSDTQQ